MDTAENLTQIGHWTLESYTKEGPRIQLFLRLTRKNLNALLSFPLTPSFSTSFHKFSKSFDLLEEEYRTGIIDRTIWGQGMLKWGTTLSKNSESI